MDDPEVENDAARHELSDWQDGTLAPWEVGVYMRLPPTGPYACWDGRKWRREAKTPQAAAQAAGRSEVQIAAWRGLAQPAGAVMALARQAGSASEDAPTGVAAPVGAASDDAGLGNGKTSPATLNAV